MRHKKRDSYFLIKSTIIVLFLIVSGFLRANSDTIPHSFYNRFELNISALNDLYSRNDSSFLQGEFYFTNNVNFDAELKKNLLFADIKVGANQFYSFLQGLPAEEKQNLLRNFSILQSLLEKELKQAGLPEELKYFPPTISAMNPLAVGENKQAGIWQLMHFQGIFNGLQINRLVDERLNEQLATKAAVKQIKQNESIFGTTELALIAYLAGNTKLQNTLLRCGADASLSEVLTCLPGFVAETIAAYQAMHVFLQVNTFQPNSEINIPDVVSVNRELHFAQISQVLNISEEQLRFLNPQYRYSIVPGDEKVMSLMLPNGKRDDYIMWLDSIYNSYDSTLFEVVAQNIEYPPAPNRQYVGEKVKDLEIEGKTKLKYTIKSGDVLGFIAEDYDVRVADLKYWNNIYNERRIQVGQKLDIFVDDDNADYYSNLQKKSEPKVESNDMVAQLTNTSPVPVYKAPVSAKKVEHIVKSGESPYVIAKKYKGVTPEEILEWNGIKDARKIQIGQKLIIYLD